MKPFKIILRDPNRFFASLSFLEVSNRLKSSKFLYRFFNIDNKDPLLFVIPCPLNGIKSEAFPYRRKASRKLICKLDPC